MWFLFTAALTRASSTTRVSIVNTSTNFILTALLGLAMFGEKLPPLWWVGAAGLVVGNVVIGRREEGGEKRMGKGGDAEGKGEPVEEEYRDGKGVEGAEEEEEETGEEEAEEGVLDGPRRRVGVKR